MIHDEFDNKLFTSLLIKGDEKAYCQLIDHYSKRLHAYALSLTRNPTEAEDILQEVFLQTWKSRNQLDLNQPLSHFLYKLVYNQFVNTYRKKKVITSTEKRYIEYLDSIVVNDSLVDDHRLKLVSKAIEKLPPKCKKVFLLSKKEGLSYPEISSYLKISVKAVEAHITKAYSVIKEKVVAHDGNSS